LRPQASGAQGAATSQRRRASGSHGLSCDRVVAFAGRGLSIVQTCVACSAALSRKNAPGRRGVMHAPCSPGVWLKMAPGPGAQGLLLAMFHVLLQPTARGGSVAPFECRKKGAGDISHRCRALCPLGLGRPQVSARLVLGGLSRGADADLRHPHGFLARPGTAHRRPGRPREGMYLLGPVNLRSEWLTTPLTCAT